MVYIFPESIGPNVNVIARLKFEITYYNVVVQHVSFYPTESSPFFDFSIVKKMPKRVLENYLTNKVIYTCDKKTKNKTKSKNEQKKQKNKQQKTKQNIEQKQTKQNKAKQTTKDAVVQPIKSSLDDVFTSVMLSGLKYHYH